LVLVLLSLPPTHPPPRREHARYVSDVFA
jgi:hypothetical protein